jgi:hypothetical protein
LESVTVVLGSSVLIFVGFKLLAGKYLFSSPNKMTDVNKDGFGCIPDLFGYSGNKRNDMLTTEFGLDFFFSALI